MKSRLGAVTAAVALLATAPAAPAHEGDPHFLSQVRQITPATAGITVEILNRDDRLLLQNTSGRDVLIQGYDEEPYARLLADGTVEVNASSEAYHLNDDRFADVDVPAGVDSSAAPVWEEVSRTGRFEWHDHRAHWMSRSTPPQVTDESVRTKIFDWEVPIEVGGQAGAIRGELFWTPLPGGGPPLAAIFVGAAALIACFIAVIVARTRRRGGGGDRPARERKEPAEAW